MVRRTLALTLYLLVILPMTCFPWGHEGHRIVAKIAAKQLTAETRAKVAAILGTSVANLEAAMAEASIWPDEVKFQTKTGNWHFVDVPISGPFDIGTLCAEHDCVIDRIEEMADRLRDNKTDFVLTGAPQRDSPLFRPVPSQELAFLIHFVRDVHQPLHSANDGDKGGNCEKLTTSITHPDPQDKRTTDLHAAWDTDEVLAVMRELGNEDATANALFQAFNNGATVQQRTPTEWAHEANSLARTDVYQALQLPNHTAKLGQCAPDIAKVTVTQQYLDGNVPDVKQQLMRAGIRLGNVLNQICGGDGCRADRPQLF